MRSYAGTASAKLTAYSGWNATGWTPDGKYISGVGFLLHVGNIMPQAPRARMVNFEQCQTQQRHL